jgi:histidinol-phosphate aminotransferase
MAAPSLAVRPDLAGLEPYVSPQLPARYRLNTNESPHPPPVSVGEEIAARVGALTLNRYPDRDASLLRAALAERAAWPEEGVWIANGSNEVLMHLFLALGGPGRRALTFEPTYSLHTLIPRIAGTRTERAERAEDWGVDVDVALRAIEVERPDVVMLCSPNNPSGGCDPRPVVEAVAEAAPGIVVVDQAYGEFAGAEASARPLLGSHPNLVVVKTFSKAWRLAGARLGYLLADPALVHELLRVRLPYHLSAPTQAIGEVALAHQDELLAAVGAVVGERDRIAVELQRMGIVTFPSRANFVLFEVDEPAEVWKALYERGVLIRNYAGRRRMARCLRVTAGLPEENDAFLVALEAVLNARERT